MPDRHLGQSIISEDSFINGSDIRDSVIGVRSRIGYENDGQSLLSDGSRLFRNARTV